jgi:hypothetical protein
MGFDDKEIVILSGAHTLGSCHLSRSGFDGKWTSKPLEFDNEYFKNLLEMEWVPKEYGGNAMFEDKVRCAFFGRNLHPMTPLSFTPLLRVKLLQACDQWHSSRVSTFLTSSHCKLHPMSSKH